MHCITCRRGGRLADPFPRIPLRRCETQTIHPETRIQIRWYSYAEHWKTGAVARELGVHPGTVRQAVESDSFHRLVPLWPSMTDAYLEFVPQTLEQHPRPTATRIYHHMIRERG